MFDGQYIILKPWVETMNALTEKFNSTTVWLQVWNLPNNWLAKNTGFRFKSLFKDVLDVIIHETDSTLGRHMKILAVVNLEKPLFRGTTFCYYCGKVSHLERNCGKKRLDRHASKLKEDQYGEWLRAVQIARQKRQQAENGKDSSIPSGSKQQVTIQAHSEIERSLQETKSSGKLIDLNSLRVELCTVSTVPSPVNIVLDTGLVELGKKASDAEDWE